MTTERLREIVTQRLQSWGVLLEHEHATPLLLLGVGHDHVSGKFCVCTLDVPEMDRAAIATLLRKALDEIGDRPADGVRTLSTQ